MTRQTPRANLRIEQESSRSGRANPMRARHKRILTTCVTLVAYLLVSGQAMAGGITCCAMHRLSHVELDSHQCHNTPHDTKVFPHFHVPGYGGVFIDKSACDCRCLPVSARNHLFQAATVPPGTKCGELPADLLLRISSGFSSGLTGKPSSWEPLSALPSFVLESVMTVFLLI